MSKTKLLKISSFYPEYLIRLYEKDPQLKEMPYSVQYQKMMEQGIGWADYWKTNLEKTGLFEVELIILNNEFAQKKWAQEHGALYDEKNWLEEIFLHQVKTFSPTIFFANDYVFVDAAMRKKVMRSAPSIKKTVGWDGIGMCDKNRFSGCDIMLTCNPYIESYYSANGYKAFYFPFAFEQSLLSKIDTETKKYDVSFVGSLTLRNNGHHGRLKVLGAVAKEVNVAMWLASFTESKPYLVKNILRKAKAGLWGDIADIVRLWKQNRGTLFGLDMYQALAHSKITLNSHIDSALNYGGNIRLWEATGVGTCLVTDWKENMSDLFVPDEEVVVYKTPEECLDKVKFLLQNPTKREAIAKAGQTRTLTQYSYEKRVQGLIPFLLA